MEGFIFTHTNVLNSIFEFIIKKKPDFLSSGHEKRILTNYKVNEIKKTKHKLLKNLWSKFYKIKPIKNILNNPHYNKFKRCKIYKNINLTEYHLPKYNLTYFDFFKLYLKSFFKFDIGLTKKKKIVIHSDRKYLIKLDDISSKNYNYYNTNYHIEKNPLFFGCSCQHLFSKNMMNNLNKFFYKNNIYNLAKLPYAGEVLEVIWPLYPKIFKKQKWFFDGIHRIRKNIRDYKREDNVLGMLKYLRFYYPEKKFIIKNNNILLKNDNYFS